MVNVFTYGTLMFGPVWSHVITGDYDSCEAILPGYQRKCVRGEVYPVIIPAAGQSQVMGILHLDVSLPDLARLDRFEGEYYFRKSVGVATMDKRMLEAETYVLKEEYYPVIVHRDWDPEHFKAADLYRFLNSYPGIEKH